MAQPCGATQPRSKDPHWVCDGSNLVIVLDSSETIPPVVLRADLVPFVDEAMAGIIAERGTRPFTGGDHVHLVIPEVHP